MVISAAIEAPKTETETSRDGPGRSLKKDFIYIVAALHDTDQGRLEAVIQVTKNPYEAVETARKAEELGYQFCSDGAGASVYRFEMDKLYNKFSFRLLDDDKIPIDYPIIFRRYLKNGAWCEEWFSETLKFIMELH